jgi:hypothetical protein
MNIYYAGVMEEPENLPDYVKTISMDIEYHFLEEYRYVDYSSSWDDKERFLYYIGVVDEEFFTFFKLKYGYVPKELMPVSDLIRREDNDYEHRNIIKNSILEKILKIVDVEDDKILLLRRIPREPT